MIGTHTEKSKIGRVLSSEKKRTKGSPKNQEIYLIYLNQDSRLILILSTRR